MTEENTETSSPLGNNKIIGLITVSDVILTGRQSGQKLQCLTVWESDGKELFPKSNFTQFVNRNVKISGGRLYSPSLKDVT